MSLPTNQFGALVTSSVSSPPQIVEFTSDVAGPVDFASVDHLFPADRGGVILGAHCIIRTASAPLVVTSPGIIAAGIQVILLDGNNFFSSARAVLVPGDDYAAIDFSFGFPIYVPPGAAVYWDSFPANGLVATAGGVEMGLYFSEGPLSQFNSYDNP